MISIEMQTSGLNQVKQSFCYHSILLNFLTTDITHSYSFWTISYSLSDFFSGCRRRFF